MSPRKHGTVAAVVLADTTLVRNMKSGINAARPSLFRDRHQEVRRSLLLVACSARCTQDVDIGLLHRCGVGRSGELKLGSVLAGSEGHLRSGNEPRKIAHLQRYRSLIAAVPCRAHLDLGFT